MIVRYNPALLLLSTFKYRRRGPSRLSSPDSGPLRRLVIKALSRLFIFEMIFNGGDKHVDADLIVSALRQYQIGVSLSGFNELQVHGLQGLLVTVYDLAHVPASLHRIPGDDPYQSVIGVRVHVHQYVQHLAQSGISEDENALHDDDVCRVYGQGLL